MQLKQLLHEDDAVSPVIGVILMVAITVILAAVIASFVLGLGDTGDPEPTPTVDFDDQGDYVNVSFTGGDSVEAGHLEISGTNLDDEGDLTDSSDNYVNNTVGTSVADDYEIGAGDTIHIPYSGEEWEIEIIWETEDADAEIIADNDG